MKKMMNKVAIAAAALSLTAGAFSASANNELDALLKQVKSDRISEAKINKKREQEFLSARADKQALLKKAKTDLVNEKARGKRLAQQYSDNEKTLAEKETELKNAQGTLGEVFGVIRRTAGNIEGRIATSIVSAQFPGRDEVVSKLAIAKEIPTLAELEELWIALQTEMTESAKVSKFNATVTELDGSSSNAEVVRIGTFNLVSDNRYLIFKDDIGQIQPLGRQPDGYIVGLVPDFVEASTGYEPLFLDPSKGTILSILKEKATLEERFHQGGTPGYIIAGVLILGLLIAIERFITLGMIGAKMRAQMRNTSTPNTNNPLGRILKVYHDNQDADVENLELKLDEAIMGETPKVERGVSVIKLLAGIAPLLGLLGTVVGMIGTFQSITLFGTGDPKIMAGDISMALVTTAEGLIAALPLIFIHSIVAGRSKAIMHVLDEQAAGIVAAHAEKERN